MPSPRRALNRSARAARLRRLRAWPSRGRCATIRAGSRAWRSRWSAPVSGAPGPGYDTLPLEFFEPMVRRVFAAPKRSLYLPNEG